nr:choice-of-anchor Q domain-containing protein [Rhodopirellula islandica]
MFGFRSARLLENQPVDQRHAPEVAKEAENFQRRKRRGTRSRRTTLNRLMGERLEERRVLAAYVVDTALDVVAEDGMISLREAIQASNSNAIVNADTVPGDLTATEIDRITFADGLSTILLGSELEVTESLQIALGDSSGQTIGGGNVSRIFAINASAGEAVIVDVSGLTLQDGLAESGGAIFVGSGQSLSLTNVTLTGNTATGDDADMGGGALAIDGGNVTITDSTITGNVANGVSGSGGGILNQGTLTVAGGQISGNTANRAGGGIEATAGSSTTLTDVLMELNVAGPDGSAAPGNGGALHLSGDGNAEISGGTIRDNTAALEGGGLWNNTGTMTVDGTILTGNVASGDAADDGGGAIFNNGGTLTVSNATISGNAADGTLGSGGGIFSTDGAVTINLSQIGGAIASEGNTANRAGGGIEVITGTVTLNFGTDVSNNFAGINGGGLHSTGAANVTSNLAIFGSNTAASEGGGLWNSSTGTMTLNGGAISSNVASGNDASNGGGGLFNDGGTLNVIDAVIGFNVADGASGSGGGILNDGTLTVSGGEISGNTANRAGGGIEATAGSGTTLTDVRLESNVAGPDGSASPGNGGALHVSGDGIVTITGGSVTDNVAANEGGGLWNSVSGSLTVDGTTVSGNSAPIGGGIFNDSGVDATSQSFETTLSTLNDSGVSGTASVTVDTSDPGNPSITVHINASGLVPNQPHIQHIHGRFASDLDSTGTIPGPFLGEGGVAIDSRTPDAGDDANGDGFITVGEGVSGYGNVLLNLSSPRAPVPLEGNSPLADFNLDDFPTAEDGTIDFSETYTFDLSDADQARQYNNLLPMSLREIVLHGVNTDVDVDGDGSPDGYRVTGPAAAGTLQAVGGMLTIVNAEISGNTATGNGGGIANESGNVSIADSSISGNVSGGDEPGEGGGGVFNDGGTVTITDSDVFENTAMVGLGNGGGILNANGGTLVVRGGTISNNDASRAGGGVENAGNATFFETEFDGNTTGINGGALHTSGPWTANFIDTTITANTAGAEGGGVWNSSAGTMTLVGSSVDGNTASGDDADQGGGGVFNDGGTLTIDSTSITGNAADGISGSGGGVLNLGSLTVTDSTISGNVANRAGGGIEVTNGSTTSLTDVNLDGNNAGVSPAVAAPGNGGGLHVTDAGTVTISGGTVNNNVAASEGGGLWNGTGVMTVTGTTISGNTASGDDADNGGGGLFNVGGTLNVNDAMITDNVADGAAGSGGGILNQGTLTVAGGQISGNTANRAGGGIEATAGSSTTLTDVLMELNVAGPDGSAAPGNGGALHLSGDGNAEISGGTIRDNTAALEGGGLWNNTGTMTVDGTILTGNVASGDAADDGGGAIFNNGGTLTVSNATISGNAADGTLGSGGGIFSTDGAVTINLSQIGGAIASEGNTANRAGGGIEVITGTVTLNFGTDVSNNFAGINGGGLHSTGAANVTSNLAIFGSNTAASEGGGLWNSSTGTMTLNGGAISSNVASGNDASNGGGGLFNDGGMLNVIDAVIGFNVADGASGSGGGIFNTGIATIDNTTISGNVANRAGGGLEAIGGSTTTFTGGSLENNVAGPSGSAAPGNGGAVHISSDGSVELTEVHVDGNTAASEGGGLWNSSTGTLVVTRSTISNNVTIDGGGIFADGDGGEVTVVNSTIASNSASSHGGGVLSEGGTVSLTSVTIADNTSSQGGGISVEAGILSLINSIVSRNTASTNPNLSGSITDNGNNLVDDDAGLGTLGEFGGPTPTIPLLAGSAALDAGVLAGLATDQRGVARPQGPGVDIGAFESDLAAPVAASLSIVAENAQRVEGDAGTTAFTFTVTRSESTTGTVTVDYSVVGDGEDPADASDFGGTLPTGTVAFADGESAATITVNVSGDTQVESDESFTVLLSNASDDTLISQADAAGVILNDDINERETRILIPTFVARPHLIPGDGIPTAIIFQALTDTTVTVTPISVTSLSETVRIVDADTLTVSSYQNGVARANLEAGELYAVIFEPLSSDRIFSIQSSAGSDTLTNRAATNILQPTDTSADGETTALDALMVINELNRLNDAGGEPLVGSFVDVNRDANVTALDALLVINHLNRMELSTNAALGELIAPQIPFGSFAPSELSSDEVDEFFDSGEVIGVDGPESKVSSTFDGSSSTATATSFGVDEAMAELDDEDPSLSMATEIELLGTV